MIINALKTVGFLGMIYFSSDISRQKEIVDNYNQNFGGKYEYLTILGLQATIYTLAIGYLAKITKINLLKIFYIHILPVISAIEFIITILFWILHWIDPTLLKGEIYIENDIKKLKFNIDNRYIKYLFNNIMFTEVFSNFIIEKIFNENNMIKLTIFLFSEPLYDFFVHLMPFILLIIEIINEKHIKKHNFHRILLIIFGVNYILWASFTAKKNKQWIYPFLNGLSFWKRILFFGFGIFLGLIGYEIIMMIKYWSKEINVKEETDNNC
ncbi:hypothetical protein DMUE_1145 [Dictyocoela muelleri]|nr:hypothetical protein DMUE_1145 [Dictyocoela muelleri]